MLKTTAFPLLFFFLFLGQSEAQPGWTHIDLPAKRFQMGAASLGSKVYFAGGITGFFTTPKVDIYDVQSGGWTSAGLSAARSLPAGVSVGSRVMFAGGLAVSASSDVVDIFDTLTQQWTTAKLSRPRFSIAAVAYGNTVLFAGGADVEKFEVVATVDMYDASTGNWTTGALSEPRAAMASAVVGTKAVFAGGYKFNGEVSDRVDIYDFSTGVWQTAALSQPRGFLSAATAGAKVVIAGGLLASNAPTDRVDIYDSETGTWTISSISTARGFIDNAASACGKAFFMGGCIVDFQTNAETDSSDVVDIYDPVSNTWSVEHLSHKIFDNAVVANGNRIFSAGGTTDLANPAGDVSTVDIYTCSTSEVEETNTERPFFYIAPNPATEVFRLNIRHINLHRDGMLRVLDPQGRVVFEKTGLAETETVQTDGLPGGLYFLKIRSSAGRFGSKVLVVK